MREEGRVGEKERWKVVVRVGGKKVERRGVGVKEESRQSIG